MGCCASTNAEAPAASVLRSNKHVGSDKAANLKGFRHESRAPPPSAEEEAVKEVLSETPKPKPKPIPHPEPISPAEMKKHFPEEEEEERETKISIRRVDVLHKIQEKQNLSGNEEITSEVSEICSVSISESVSTMTTVTEKRNNDEKEEEVQQETTKRQRVISSSPAKPPQRNGFKRDRVVNQSPTRRSDQSPNKRISNGSVRLVQKQEPGQVRGPARSEPGESSGRRSRSTSTAMGRSPSVRRKNNPPGRVGSVVTENINGFSLNSSRKMEPKWATNENSKNENENCTTNESLENPLVSLECFIFL